MATELYVKKIWKDDGSISSGHLFFKKKPYLLLDTGEKLDSEKEQVFYEIEKEILPKSGGLSITHELNSPSQIVLKPRLCTIRKFSVDAKEALQDIYPPSTNGFYGRLIRGRGNAQYFIQDILNDDKLWLTVVDKDTGLIYESHSIQRYEFDSIRMKTFFDFFDELLNAFSNEKSKSIQKTVLQTLNTKISWAELAKLSGGNISPSFVLGETSKESLCQLVAIHKYPKDTQDEILAFLIWVAKGIIPDGNIIEFLDSVHSLPTFRSLFMSHLRFVMDCQEIPPYLTLVQNALMPDALNLVKYVISEERKERPDTLLRLKIQSMSPDWQESIVDIVKELNSKKEITTSIPETQSSSSSIEAQRTRLLMNDMGLRLAAHVRLQSIGLRELVYLGAAHRWPHWHLSFSIRLSPINKQSLYIQDIVVPPAAAEKIKRILPKTIEIAWSSRKVNVHLFDRTHKEWTIKLDSIRHCSAKGYGLQKLRNEFGDWKGSTYYELNESEARLLDMAANMFYLSDLESEAGKRYWNTDPEKSKTILTKLQNLGIIDVYYWYNRLPTLSRAFIMFEGSDSHVCALAKSLLKYAPTSLVMVSEDGKVGFAISRIPTEEESNFYDLMTEIEKENEMNIRCDFPPVLRNYMPDLFQRLLNADNSWNDDISGFLSQIRSLPKSFLDEMNEDRLSD